MLVLANKCDLAHKGGDNQEDEEDEPQIEVTDEDIAQFEQKHNLKVCKTSARTSEGVDEAFLELTKTLIKKNKNQPADVRKK